MRAKLSSKNKKKMKNLAQAWSKTQSSLHESYPGFSTKLSLKAVGKYVTFLSL